MGADATSEKDEPIEPQNAEQIRPLVLVSKVPCARTASVSLK